MSRLAPLLILLYASIARPTIFGLGSATTPGTAAAGEFRFYWNVPTFMCHKHGILFDEVSQTYGILQNEGDKFRGDQIAILYDPGMFPALLTDSEGYVMVRNGGVPQEGNLTKHVEVFREHLLNQVPDKYFRGIGVIDFESWRPIFRQNWASLAPYRDMSIDLERKKHPLWNDNAVKKEAKRRFEKYGRLFMEVTLKVAKASRPLASWGYYAYPYCYNLTPNNPGNLCAPETVAENDKMAWLFSKEGVILPSLYLRYKLNDNQKVGLVSGRVKEALRLASKLTPRQQVLPYYWYKYQDQQDKYVDSSVLEATMRKIADLGADGIIIWGSSDDLKTKGKCLEFEQYLNNVLGPAVLRVRQQATSGRSYENGTVNEADDNAIDKLIEST